MKKGVLIDDISCQMNWQDFECLVAEILESKNFVTRKNIVLKKPRRQIDVVGSRLGVTMIIDCKHWKRYSSSALRNVVKNQIERSKHYLTNTKGTIGIPVIVTTDYEKIDFINKVPLVPIHQFESFVDESLGNLDKMRLLRA